MLRVIIICGIVIISFVYFINKLLFEIRSLENKVKETNNNQKNLMKLEYNIVNKFDNISSNIKNLIINKKNTSKEDFEIEKPKRLETKPRQIIIVNKGHNKKSKQSSSIPNSKFQELLQARNKKRKEFQEELLNEKKKHSFKFNHIEGAFLNDFSGNENFSISDNSCEKHHLKKKCIKNEKCGWCTDSNNHGSCVESATDYTCPMNGSMYCKKWTHKNKNKNKKNEEPLSTAFSDYNIKTQFVEEMSLPYSL